MSELKEYYIFIVSNHFLKSASIVLLSIVFAKLVDIVFTLVFRRMVDKTATKLDDKILHLLHKPIFYSILFIGFNLSVKTGSNLRKVLLPLRFKMPSYDFFLYTIVTV